MIALDIETIITGSWILDLEPGCFSLARHGLLQLLRAWMRASFLPPIRARDV